MLGGIDVDRLHALQDLAGGGIHVADRLHLVAEQFDPHQPVLVGRTDLQHVATHPEAPAADFDVVAGILIVDQFPQGGAQVELLPTSNFTAALRYSEGMPRP